MQLENILKIEDSWMSPQTVVAIDYNPAFVATTAESDGAVIFMIIFQHSIIR